MLVSVCVLSGELRISGLMPSKIMREREERDIQCGGYMIICKNKDLTIHEERETKEEEKYNLGITRGQPGQVNGATL
jgi:hypothetical protein